MIRSRRLPGRVAAALALAIAGFGVALASPAGTAQAATPAAWGYALVLHPSGPVSATHWKESVASPTPAASPGAPGQVFVKFPKIGHKQGIVHVTAIVDELAWCQAQRWYPSGGKEIVAVRCFRKGGIPTFVPFTVVFTTSSGKLPGGLRYAYVHDSGTSVVSSYNSTGRPDTVSALSTGVWRVKLPGHGPATHSGGIQVTAVNRLRPAICDVGGQTWSSSGQTIIVRCYGPSGKPLKTGWNLSYQRSLAITGGRPPLFAYTLNTKPLVAGPYAPAPPGVNVNTGGGLNKIQRSGGGKWLVRLPQVGILPNALFVTAASSGPRVCNLNATWGTSLGRGTVTVRSVVCYKVSGAMAPGEWFLTYTGPTVKSTTTTLTASPSPATTGQTVTLTATVSTGGSTPSHPAGRVEFEAGGTVIGSPVTVNAGNVSAPATTTTTFSAAGTENLSAVFTPTDTTGYSGSTGTYKLGVMQASGLPATGSPVSVTVTVPTLGTLSVAVVNTSVPLTLNSAGTAATGMLGDVTVTDNRNNRPGWSVSGQQSNFTEAAPGTATIPGDQAGWMPTAVGALGRGVTLGPTIAPGTSPGGLGDTGGTLISATPGNGFGTNVATAALTLDMPTGTTPGSYSCIMTVTYLTVGP